MDELLAELFSSKVRAAVLADLLPRPHLGFSLTDLSRRLGLPISSLQHECYKLTRLGVLRDERAGGARLYQPNPAWPLLAPLTALVAAAIGLEPAFRAALEGIPRLELALLAGVLAPAPPRTEPVRLVLVGELSLEQVDAALARVASLAEPVLGRDAVELAYFRPNDWRARRANSNPFVAGLLTGPCLVLAGSPDR